MDVRIRHCQVILLWRDSAPVARLRGQLAGVFGPEGEGIAASVAV